MPPTTTTTDALGLPPQQAPCTAGPATATTATTTAPAPAAPLSPPTPPAQPANIAPPTFQEPASAPAATPVATPAAAPKPRKPRTDPKPTKWGATEAAKPPKAGKRFRVTLPGHKSLVHDEQGRLHPQDYMDVEADAPEDAWEYFKIHNGIAVTAHQPSIVEVSSEDTTAPEDPVDK